MSSDKDRKWARKKLLKATGREPTQAEIEAKIAQRSGTLPALDLRPSPSLPEPVSTPLKPQPTSPLVVEGLTKILEAGEYLSSSDGVSRKDRLLCELHTINGCLEFFVGAMPANVVPADVTDAITRNLLAIADRYADLLQGLPSAVWQPIEQEGKSRRGTARRKPAHVWDAVAKREICVECRYRIDGCKSLPKARELVINDLLAVLPGWTIEDLFPKQQQASAKPQTEMERALGQSEDHREDLLTEGEKGKATQGARGHFQAMKADLGKRSLDNLKAG